MADVLVSQSRLSSTRVSLPAFPAEILRSIFELLSPADFRSLCLVCKAIRPHAEPLFYSQIDFLWLDKVPPITSLLRTLLARPQLAAHVRGVSLGYPPVQVSIRNYPFVKVPVTEKDVGLPIAFVESLKLPDDGFWVQELRAGTMDAYVAVLLSQLHNLRRLDMCGHFTNEMILVGTVFWCALCEGVDRGLPAFEYLEEVSVTKRWTYYGSSSIRNTQDLLPLFHLPALKHMKLWLDDPESLDPKTIGWPTGQVPKACMLRLLELVNIREPQLRHVLEATTCLQSLRWVWNHDEDFEYYIDLKPIIDLDEIGRAVAPVKDTLTRLEIVVWASLGGDALDEPYLDVTGSLRSLRQFTKLKSVEVPLVFLVASLSPHLAKPFAESLPRNLEYLTVSTELLEQEELEWTGRPILDALRPWLEFWRDYTPNMRIFHLKVDLCHWAWTTSARDVLVELGVTAGLQIQVTESEALKSSRARFTEIDT
ncbi:hypothetical protein DL546_009555 [Coniochaeta pulveracea]|uniref:F-box domain-containing protein n=1 Tax=Coniochaeta pulveracea TaxID=177199 RepID=A0A420YN18_9PEZI|nr:hypothetical protein DL546_009555 [Coniochaeta pulveracea]